MKTYYNEKNKTIKELLTRCVISENRVIWADRSCRCCKFKGLNGESLMDLYFIDEQDVRPERWKEVAEDRNSYYYRQIFPADIKIFPILKKYKEVKLIYAKKSLFVLYLK
ncbi:MAG: hypothetical protein KGO96_06925 [Elusimicrobia bacterium]|nr:hypothetical protein [Elusimicrobiota bacterium]